MSVPKHIQAVYQRSTCLYTNEQVDKALDDLAQQIHNELETENPLLLCVMVGGLVLTGNLLPRLDFALELDYVHATRYRGDTRGGDIEWKAAPTTKIKDRTILVVDDILDGGITLQQIIDYCHSQGAKRVCSAVLVDKEHKREATGLIRADFTGLTVGDRYIFGYGMDYKEYLRNAPGVYVVAPEDQ